MKLHLPKGLRTALLAVVALASSANVAQAAPAVYDYAVVNKPGEIYETQTPVNAIQFTFYDLDDLDMSKSWLISFAPQSLWGTPCVDQDKYPGGCVVVGNVGVPYKSTWNRKGDLPVLPKPLSEAEFAIYFCPNGNIYAISKEGGKQLLGTDPNGLASLTQGITPFQITLNWVVNEDGTGSLYYTSGSAASVSYDGVIKNGDTTNFTKDKVTILKDVELTATNVATLSALFTSSSANTQAPYSNVMYIATNEYNKGSGNDPSMWQITGKADLSKLKAGEYLDNTTTGDGVGTARELVVPTQDDEGDIIHFVGDTGVVFTETDDILSNKTVAVTDVLNGGNSCSVGFGAGADATLTVEYTAIADSVLNSADRAPVRIVGDGTVKLMTDADTSDTTKKTILVKSIDNNSTLHIHSSNDTSLSLTEGTIGKNANIVHTGDNTDLRYVTVSLKADGDNSTKVQLNSIDVQNGHLNVTGLQVAADGSRSYAQLQANEIKASESLYIEADAVLGSIESDGNQNLSGGTISAGSITATTGTIYVDGAKVTAGTVSAGTNVEVSARLKATTVTAGESVTVDGGTLDAVTITAEDVALTTGVLTAGTVITDKVENGVLSVTSASSQGRAAAALLSGNVKVTATEIKADSLADGAEVEIDSSSAGVLSVKKLSNNDVSVGADFIMTNASTNSGISIGAKATVASGSLSADEVTLTDGYVIKAGKLTTDIILTDGAVYDGKGNSGVMMTNVQLAEMSVTADTIEAAEVSIEKGYTVNKAEVTADTTINAGRTEESRVILNNVGFSGPVKTSGYVELNSVKFKGGNQAFGGANGDAFRVDKDAQGVENVILKGDLKGTELTIDSMVLNAEALKFEVGAGETTYSLINPKNGTLSYAADPTNYELYIQPYVRAEINVDKQTGEVTITGWEDESGIKNEMGDTANRRATTGALDALKPTIEDDGSALSELDKYVGHVNRYSLEDRKEVLDALSGASLSALADSQRRGVQDHQDNLRNRIIQMGGGTNAGLTTDWQYAGIQAWAQADGSFSTTDGSGDECGYDFDTWGATVGANLDLTANTVVGLAFSASYGEIKSDGADHASGNNDAQYISFYARHQKDRWVQMFILTAGMNEMDMERRVMGYSASGDTEGTTLSAYYELGYTIGLNYEYTHILQPMVSVSLTSAKIDGYTEEGSLDNAALEYDGDSYIYGKVGIGARYQGVLYETIHERNAVVEARALVTQDFGDTTETTKVSLGGSPMYEVSGADTSGTGFELGAGVSIPVEQHTTFYADADMTVAPDYTGFRVDLGVRYDF